MRSIDEKYECRRTQPFNVYRTQVSYSGALANLALLENDFTARLTASGQFVEIMTQMDAVLNLSRSMPGRTVGSRINPLLLLAALAMVCCSEAKDWQGWVYPD